MTIWKAATPKPAVDGNGKRSQTVRRHNQGSDSGWSWMSKQYNASIKIVNMQADARKRPHPRHEQPCVCTSEGSGCKHFKFHVWLLQIAQKTHHLSHLSTHQHIPEDTRPVGHRRANDFGRHVGSADYGGTFSKARFHGLSLGKNTHVTRHASQIA